MHDIAIVGGGPSGLTAAIYARRAGKSALLFEGGLPGGKLHDIKALENYPGFTGSGAELADKIVKQALQLGCELIPRFVTAVFKESDIFYLTAGKDTFEARSVIYCGGFARKTYAFAEKFEGRGVSYCAVCDGNFFRDKPVAVVGKGEAALEDVLYLAAICAKVYYITENPARIDKDNVEICVGRLSNITGNDGVEACEVVTGQINRSLNVSAVFLAMGAKADSILPFIKADGFIDAAASTTEVDGLFAAGDIIGGTLKQVVVACGSGATAAQKAVTRLNSIKF